jgi:hypothetical protein
MKRSGWLEDGWIAYKKIYKLHTTRAKVDSLKRSPTSNYFGLALIHPMQASKTILLALFSSLIVQHQINYY